MKRKALPFLLLPAAFIGLLLFTRFGIRPGAPSIPTPSSIPAPETGGTKRSLPETSPARSASAGRSHAELLAWARRHIHEGQARWAQPWWQGHVRPHPPLPKDPAFWALVDELKKELGPNAPAVLSDLIDEAVSDRAQQIYTALLAGLKDPAAEPRLVALLSVSPRTFWTRGIALYGLGLLNTDSAWAAALEAWDKDKSGARSLLYPGFGLFGDRAFRYLLKEAETAPHIVHASAALQAIQSPESKNRLWNLAETGDSEILRTAALRAACRDPDAATVARLFDLLDHPETSSARRIEVSTRLRELFAMEDFSLDSDPRLLERILSKWTDLPLDVRWSLWTDPAVRRAKPDALDGLQLPDKMKWTVTWALGIDPGRHAQLAEYAAAHPNDNALHWSIEAIKRQGGHSDPSLTAVARQMALSPPAADDEGGGRYWAWQMLSLGPAEERAKTLDQVSELVERTPAPDRRLRWAADLSMAGPDAGPVAVRMLRQETDPFVRLELIATALSCPGSRTDLQAVAAAEIDQVLSGATELGMRFVVCHPWGKDDGLDRYALIVREIFNAYGTPEHLPRIREYFSRLVVPAVFRAEGDDALRSDESYRESLQHELMESIDAIRARN